MRACLVLTISLCAGEVVASAQRGDAATREPAVQDILLRAASFVQNVSASLSGVLAQESYEQDLFTYPLDTGARPRIGRRSMGSEALFLWLPAANEWMFVRNVLAVDGRPVPDSGERLDRLFKDLQKDPRLGVWVPWQMTEQYSARNGETITGMASYTNFRRFDASVRVLTP